MMSELRAPPNDTEDTTKSFDFRWGASARRIKCKGREKR